MKEEAILLGSRHRSLLKPFLIDPPRVLAQSFIFTAKKTTTKFFKKKAKESLLIPLIRSKNKFYSVSDYMILKVQSRRIELL
jgi:hypothetical protein